MNKWNQFSGNRRRNLLAGFAVLGWLAGSLAADSIVTSKHNLSTSGTGPIGAATESEICIFCHTPHSASTDAPLWNRYSSGAVYTPYDSSTTLATIGQPTGASKLCLSCHDGTIALGMVRSRVSEILMSDGSTLPAGGSNLTSDLSNDHPVSFNYDSQLANASGELHDPATLSSQIFLESGQMQCTSCHDAHDDRYGDFLVIDNSASALCLECHDKAFWNLSTHRTSQKTWDQSSTDPWPHTEETTVASNACENCHRPHSAGNPERLLNFANEEQNCYTCHNGHVAATDIQAEFSKSSTHPITQNTWIHDPTEDLVNPPRHVECADCHNSHGTNDRTANAPVASGALEGVTGVNLSGALADPVQNEFELCFRCHADSTQTGQAHVNRQYVQTNTRLEFGATSASFHPVAAVGKNSDVPSLITPWTTNSMMYCTDCHNNDQGPAIGGGGPNGPHGSTWSPILERQLVLGDNQSENSSIYALCYKCHSRSSILADESFSEHKKHIEGEKTACTTCHDPHGVVGVSHLINFNLDYVNPVMGIIEFVDTGRFRGSCTLTCHGERHRNEDYKP